jgi:amylosucrase
MEARRAPPPAGAEGEVTEEEIQARLQDWREDLASALAGLYPGRSAAVWEEVVSRAARSARARKPALVALDRQRERQPDWYLCPERIGYAAYADRFGGDLRGVERRVGYLRELGVDVLHLMSVLRPRAGDNDGGFAIDDYLSPDPRLGTVADLERLIGSLREAGISTCLDLVMNHTSSDHEWAVKARQGSPYHRGLYLAFPDRTVPDAFEATLPEVFPTMSPGNFTWVEEMEAWVWTTFREFQWDLNWANPDVLIEMVEVVLHLANMGVEIVRLDAVAFTWKRMGTNCQNQPEAHLIAQALRAALGMAAPACILLAEAIVGPEDLVPYLGAHERQRRECQLAYHNQLMVQGWSMLAGGGTRLATVALGRLPTPPAGTTWVNYVRCHDDIGWAISDQDAASAGLDGAAHRRFLAAFYRGDFPLSFARGVPFSTNLLTGDERTSGMASTLAGITAGGMAADADQLGQGVARLLLMYGLVFGFGGLPMIYMGDELGLGDDESYQLDANKAGDSRWRHRPVMDEAAMAGRHDRATVPGAVWAGIRRLTRARRACAALHAAGTVEVLPTGDQRVFAWVRRHPRYGSVLGLANVSGAAAHASPALLEVLDLSPVTDLLDPGATDLLQLEPYAVRWLSADAHYRTAPAPPR